MRIRPHAQSPARGIWVGTAVTLVLVFALTAQVTAKRPGELVTGEAGTGDSPRQPGRAAACLGGRLDLPRNVPLTWWFEYGPTAAYGSQTPARQRRPLAIHPFERNCDADGDDLRDAVDDLPYGATYHYRLVGRFMNGRVEVGEDRTFTTAATALRPPQRVSFQHDTGGPGTSVLTNIRVHDAPRGSLVTTNRCHELSAIDEELGRTRIRRQAQLVLRRVVVRRFQPQPGRPHVGLEPCGANVTVRVVPPAGRGTETATAIHPRGRRAPLIETECVQPLVRRCVSISATSQGARLMRLAFENVLHGSTVRIECAGAGCPAPQLEREIRAPRGRGPYGRLRPPGYERLRPGARLRIFISRPGSFGAYRSLRVTRAEVRMSGYGCLDAERPRRIVACP